MRELIIKEREIKEKIIGVINNSGLPAFILKSIIKELYEQINTLAEKQYEEARNAKELKKESE